MENLFDHIPIVVLVLGICVLMRYPYLGAGLMLAAVCWQVQQYWLMAGCLLVGPVMHIVMSKRIRTHRGIGPSRQSQRKKQREVKKAEQEGGEDGQET